MFVAKTQIDGQRLGQSGNHPARIPPDPNTAWGRDPARKSCSLASGMPKQEIGHTVAAVRGGEVLV